MFRIRKVITLLPLPVNTIDALASTRAAKSVVMLALKSSSNSISIVRSLTGCGLAVVLSPRHRRRSKPLDPLIVIDRRQKLLLFQLISAASRPETTSSPAP